MVLESIKDRLLNGERTVGVWGTGYIGYSTMANFAFNGVMCLGTDVVQEKVDTINRGQIPIENFEKWLGFEVKPLAENGLLRATTDWKSMLRPEIAVHMIAIPTEKDGKPYDVILEDVIKKISGFRPDGEPPIVIIESTLTPGRTDKVVIPIFEKAGLKVGKDVLVGIAPRRDWFISPEKSLKNLPRIIGGTNQETTRIMKDVLSIVCDHLLPAPDHRHAEMIKSIENAYRHAEITLANQLSLAYPDIDMEEVLKLVGTKWNVGTYKPSFGTGGYCLPGDEFVFFEVDGQVICERIGDAVNNARKLKHSDVRALSLDTETGEYVYKKVLGLSSRNYKGKMVEIFTKYNRRLMVTADHPMLVSCKNRIITKPASELKEGDKLVFATSLPQERTNLEIDLIKDLGPDLRKRARVIPISKKFEAYKGVLHSHIRREKNYYEIYRNNSMSLRLYLELESKGMMPIKREEISLYTGFGRVNRIPAVIKIDEEFAEFIGYYLSEGCLTRDKSFRAYFSFNKKEKSLIKFVTNYLRKLGVSYVEYADKNFETWHIRISSFIFANLIKNVLRCGENSYSMRIPSLFFKAPDGIRFALLKGLMNGDGSVSARGQVEYYTVSGTMTQQVILMLQSFGIMPSIKRNHNKKSDLIRVHGSENLDRMKNLFRGKKGILLNDFLKKSQKYTAFKTQTELLNFVSDNSAVSPLQASRSLQIGYDMARSNMISMQRRGILTSKRLERNESGLRFFSPETERSFEVLAIEKAEITDTEASVFSMEVEGTHTFVTSYGIVVHNCIPLSSQYVLLGAKNPEQLTILKSAIETDREQPAIVAESVVKKGCRKVGILGLAYKGDIKVDILSPTIRMAQSLKEKGVSVKVHDPLYSEQEIKKITGCETFRFPEGLQEFDAVLLVADHQLYKFTPNTVVLDNLKKCRLVLDNTGIWRDINFKRAGVEYHVAGDKGWLQ